MPLATPPAAVITPPAAPPAAETRPDAVSDVDDWAALVDATACEASVTLESTLNVSEVFMLLNVDVVKSS
jgi:hypothetical protein